MGRTVAGGRLVASRPHKVKAQCVTLTPRSPPRAAAAAAAAAEAESGPLTQTRRAAKRLFNRSILITSYESLDNIAQSLQKITDREPWPLPKWVRSIGRGLTPLFFAIFILMFVHDAAHNQLGTSNGRFISFMDTL